MAYLTLRSADRWKLIAGLVLGVVGSRSISARAQGARDITVTSEAASGWLDGLYARVAATVNSGKPVVLQAHVALCDNTILNCGAQGDGDNIKKNLYWTTSGAVDGWFRRQRAVWTEVSRSDTPPGDSGVLQIRIYRAHVGPSARWRQRGVTKPFEVYAVIYGWRGKDIDKALNAYMDDLYHCTPRAVQLPDGGMLQAGGQAHLVAWIGHNRMMDLDREQLRRLLLRTDSCSLQPKGMIAVACRTGSYLGRYVSSAERVPLLLTDSLLFAGTHAFEGAARAFMYGSSLAEIRTAGANAYAEGQGKPAAQVSSAFVNPTHKHWRW